MFVGGGGLVFCDLFIWTGDYLIAHLYISILFDTPLSLFFYIKNRFLLSRVNLAITYPRRSFLVGETILSIITLFDSKTGIVFIFFISSQDRKIFSIAKSIFFFFFFFFFFLFSFFFSLFFQAEQFLCMIIGNWK